MAFVDVFCRVPHPRYSSIGESSGRILCCLHGTRYSDQAVPSFSTAIAQRTKSSFGPVTRSARSICRLVDSRELIAELGLVEGLKSRGCSCKASARCGRFVLTGSDPGDPEGAVWAIAAAGNRLVLHRDRRGGGDEPNDGMPSRAVWLAGAIEDSRRQPGLQLS